MRIQLASDLHLEMIHRNPSLRSFRAIDHTDADLLVLAGDVHNGRAAVQAFADWPVPVVLVPGNHELYDAEATQCLADMRDASAGTAVRVLQNETAVIGGVRIAATTLWTDFAVYPDREAQALNEVPARLHDYRKIRVRQSVDGWLTPQITLGWHRLARQFLETTLKQPFAGPTVVVTHHLPSPRSIHARFHDNIINAGFASNLEPLMGGERAALWCHGHGHDSMDYVVRGTRVVSNPRGYARGWREAHDVSQLQFENAAFDPAMIVEV